MFQFASYSHLTNETEALLQKHREVAYFSLPIPLGVIGLPLESQKHREVAYFSLPTIFSLPTFAGGGNGGLMLAETSESCIRSSVCLLLPRNPRRTILNVRLAADLAPPLIDGHATLAE